ncbi:MAG: glycosyltransferase [Alphaproteobacteria bacterium]|nr:glycosyltransferase [Alphaproteobacteria bacterium]
MNDDVAVVGRGWLREMVAHALRPGVGAVGAKLYYPDGTIQHAGVVTGMLGVAGHPFRHASKAAGGPSGRLKHLQTVSCVTAACMVLRRSVYAEVGGMDETNLPISYNDVDLCLRLRERGYRTVWTPWAELEHWESATRGADIERRNASRARAEAEYMWRRWGPVLRNDPYYNPNLTLSAEDAGLAFPPRVTVPWAEYLPRERRYPDGGRRRRSNPGARRHERAQ